MTMIIDGTNGLTFPDTSKQYNSYYSFKNRIINGAMVIDQRNAGAEVNPAVQTTYYLDRWLVSSSAASKFKIGQNAGSVTPPTGFINYLGLTSLSAYTVGTSESFGVRQRIEGLNVADLAWGTASAATVTLSFWVYSSLTGTFGGSLRNSDSTRSYPFSYTISSANTWEQKSVTIAGDTSGTWLTTNGVGIQPFFSIGAGATVSGTAGAWSGSNLASVTGAVSVVGTNGATFYITGVQLEKGSTATSFDYRPYGTELALCQRYYFRRNSVATTDYVGNLQAYSTGAVYGKLLDLPVVMRASPTVNVSSATHFSPYNSGGVAQAAFSSVGAFSASSPYQITQNGGFAGSSGLTAGNCSIVIFNTASGWVDASAEL